MEAIQLYNLDVLKTTTAGDDEFLHKILSTFLANNQDMIRKVHQFFREKEYFKVGECAHKMLGSYRHLEVNFLDATLSELESLTFGKVLTPSEIGNHIEVLTKGSEKVFKGIEAELAQIKY